VVTPARAGRYRECWPRWRRLPRCCSAYYAFVAVSLPFPDPDVYASTMDVVRAEALVLVAGASLAYAAWGLIRFSRGRTPRWLPVAITYAVGTALTPLAWLVLVAWFSGG
jgi:hypothetical protein